MFEHPEITMQAVAVGGLLIGGYGALASAILKRGGLTIRWDETLTLGACLTIVAGSLLGLAARTTLALESRSSLPAPRIGSTSQ